MTDLGVLPGFEESGAVAINNSGQIAGNCEHETLPRAFLWQNGKMTDLGTLQGIWSEARAMNDRGQVVGRAYGGGGSTAFLFDGSKMTALDPSPGNSLSFAYGINNASQIVGFYQKDIKSSGYGVLWENSQERNLGSINIGTINNHGQMIGSQTKPTQAQTVTRRDYAVVLYNGKVTDLGLAAFRNDSSGATAINDQGHVVGEVSLVKKQGDLDIDTGDAFLYRDGKTILLGRPKGYGDSEPYSINNRDQIVGRTFSTEPLKFVPGVKTVTKSCAFLWESGKSYNLNDLIGAGSGWELDVASGINDKGQIVGTGIHNGQTRAFLLTPVESKNVPQ